MDNGQLIMDNLKGWVRGVHRDVPIPKYGKAAKTQWLSTTSYSIPRKTGYLCVSVFKK